MAGPSATDQQLAEEIRETAHRLTDAIEGLRREASEFKADIKVEIAKINTSLAWMKTISGLVGLSLVGLLGMTYQAGNRAGQIESAINSLQKTTEEIRADLKGRDKPFSDSTADIRKAADDSRKADDELKASHKIHSDDMVRLQLSVDHLKEGVGKINEGFSRMFRPAR